ncbi:GDSL esterase/lipase [Acorus calamus]|uniref:GDSL esterase/lipase n=1 Tax=Acorus calamus TaxID=4465 RepID=A0AAV9DMM0_ACOCL|nr:GDSL esterase/lipase [Acorus calamus]
MACKPLLLVLLLSFSFSFAQDQQPQSPTTPLVPALFVIGDSSVDCGTNNYLGTVARADRPPYGRDFDTHNATGRFSNGRVVVDYLALNLGLPFVPAYLGWRSGNYQDMIHGMNYASAAAGIFFSSGSDMGQHVSLTQQIQQFSDTAQQLSLSLGPGPAADLIVRSVVYVSIGSNDFIHLYLANSSNIQSEYLPWEFSHILASNLKQELKNLYNTNARKVVVMGIAPLGCTPHYLFEYRSQDGRCIKEINDAIIEFNFELKYMVNELNKELAGAQFTFCDAFEGSMDILANQRLYGFETTTEACCGMGLYGGWIMCLLPEMACQNASTHVWWDEFHPTDAVNKILAENVWSGLHVKMCYPINLQEMVPQATSPTPAQVS